MIEPTPLLYLSSVEPPEHTAAQWQSLVRGHWAGVKIRNHWRHDVLWREDRSRARHPSAPANLALLRPALLALVSDHFGDLSLPQIQENLHPRPGACFRALRA